MWWADKATWMLKPRKISLNTHNGLQTFFPLKTLPIPSWEKDSIQPDPPYSMPPIIKFNHKSTKWSKDRLKLSTCAKETHLMPKQSTWEVWNSFNNLKRISKWLGTIYQICHLQLNKLWTTQDPQKALLNTHFRRIKWKFPQEFMFNSSMVLSTKLCIETLSKKFSPKKVNLK